MKKNLKVKKTHVPSDRKLIIKYFLEEGAGLNDKYFWPREMKMAGELLKIYPVKFLLECKLPFGGKQLKSLSFFKSDYGAAFLREHYMNYLKDLSDFSVNKEPNIPSNTKVGEDIIIQKKPKTLKDFLNLYGKNN